MLGYFPTPYFDELWYSSCARFARQMRFGTETGVMLALYGRRHAIATVDLPHRLNALVCQLPTGHPSSISSIIDHQTFLPYYGPFLATAMYRTVRRLMEDGTKPSVRVRCGACTNRVRPPKFFRSCPICDRENRERFGETYWRRLFQLPGVEVCPSHKVFLESSDIRLDPLPNRHKYFSAESAKLASTAQPADFNNPAHRALIELSLAVEWILKQEHLNPGLDALHARYEDLLAKRGLATKAGSVRMIELRRQVVARYGNTLLELLQSNLLKENGDGWLGHLLRKTNTAVAPLRHLLVLQALEVDLDRFFFPEKFKETPHGVLANGGLWSCLNRVCDQYQKPVIDHVESQPADSNGNSHSVITCPVCRFRYQIREGEATPTRANRILDYGQKWTEILTQQWAEVNITLRQMAKNLGVDPKTVKQHASKLRLKFPRKGERVVTRRGLYVPAGRDKAKEIESHRQKWLKLRTKNPALGTKALRLRSPALYAWLYLNDRSWFAQNRPIKRTPVAIRNHVDWAKRDEELAGQIATIAAYIKHRPGKPKRVTTTAIGRALGKQSLFEAALKKLPLTHSVIKGVLETNEEFAARRVHTAARRLRKLQGTIVRWKLVRAAGLHYQLERQPKVKAALDYEVRPPVAVTILQDGVRQFPRELVRRPARIPSRIRPLAVVQPIA
jgi:hypothetical protein